MSFRELVLTALCTVLNLWILQFKRGSSVEKLLRNSYLLSDWEEQSSFYFFQFCCIYWHRRNEHKVKNAWNQQNVKIALVRIYHENLQSIYLEKKCRVPKICSVIATGRSTKLNVLSWPKGSCQESCEHHCSYQWQKLVRLCPKLQL